MKRRPHDRESGRWLAYAWAAPATALGVVLIAIAGTPRRRCACVDGVLEAHGPGIRWGLRHLTILPGGASAITFGHVVMGIDAEALEATRTHERVHVRQYERWGPLFIPAYLVASAWAAACGRRAYADNPFEHEARVAEARAAARRVRADAIVGNADAS